MKQKHAYAYLHEQVSHKYLHSSYRQTLENAVRFRLARVGLVEFISWSSVYNDCVEVIHRLSRTHYTMVYFSHHFQPELFFLLLYRQTAALHGPTCSCPLFRRKLGRLIVSITQSKNKANCTNAASCCFIRRGNSRCYEPGQVVLDVCLFVRLPVC